MDLVRLAPNQASEPHVGQEAQGDKLTELEEQDLKKDIAKMNTTWERQSKRDSVKPSLKMRLKDSKVEVI